MRSYFSVLLVLLAASISAFAQEYPYPAPVGAPTPTYDGRPTAQFSSPITAHVGRFLDSNGVREYQGRPRTLRAERVAFVPERDRVYMNLGASRFASYRLSTFFTQDLAQPIVPITRPGASANEKYLPWYGFVDAEEPGSGWITNIIDGQDRLVEFDWDDRGLVYLGYGPYGWGIVRDDGPGLLPLVSQVQGLAGAILAIKAGAKYYTVLVDPNSSRIYDVTVPSAPIQKLIVPFGGNKYAKAAGGAEDRIALGTGTSIKIWRAGDFVNNLGPEASFSAPSGHLFVGLTSDGTNFYAVETTSAAFNHEAILWVIKPTGSGFVESKYSTGPNFFASTLDYSSGYLTMFGAFSAWDLRLFRLVNGVPQEVSLNGFIKEYYFTPPPGFAVPGNIFGQHAAVYQQDGTEYLVFSGTGIGDVYQLGGRSLPAVPPQADFRWSPASPSAGQSVLFIDSSTGAPATWEWDFTNDGVTDSTAKFPSYVYTDGGTHTVRLTVTNSRGWHTATKTITIGGGSGGSACTVSCTAFAPPSAAAGTQVAFGGSATAQYCTGTTSYTWSFGDGTASSSVNPHKTYTTAGTYNWSLTVQNGGVTCTRTGTIQITAPPPPPVRPVLLVNGFCSDPGTWAPMIQNLRSIDAARYKDRYDVWYDGARVLGSTSTIPTGRTYALVFRNNEGAGSRATEQLLVRDVPLADLAYQLKKVVEKLSEIHGGSPIDIVAHGMGGLVARAYVEGFSQSYLGVDTPYDGDHVRRIITIDTPHDGVLYPSSLPGSCIPENSVQKGEMLAGSEFLSKLNSRAIPSRIQLISVASRTAESASDGVVNYDSQRLNNLSLYQCSATGESNVETLTNVVEHAGEGVLHQVVHTLPAVAQIVDSRLAYTNGATRCRQLRANSVTLVDPPTGAARGLFFASFEFGQATAECSVEVIARSSTGVLLGRFTIPAKGHQTVALGELAGSGWRLELLSTCSVPAVINVFRRDRIACANGSGSLCLQTQRFRVSAAWTDFQGNTGTGTASPLTSDTGYFWFFDPANVELVVKVLDGRGITGAFWVFYGALSNVAYTMTVTDTTTGERRLYQNPSGQFASVGDTSAFRSSSSTSAASQAETSILPLSSTSTTLRNGRFEVSIQLADGRIGQAVRLTSDTAYFWFFNDTNVEVVLKVLDGTALNGHHWVFYGSLSNVGYTVTVKDTLTGVSKTYTNPQGTFASAADTSAFATP